jgi:hypothetical protein
MPNPPNPFFALQSRAKALLGAATYFATLRDDQILTQETANLEFEVPNKILPLGFGIVITTASGKPIESSYEALITMEDLNVYIVHNPSADPAHNILDAVNAAIAALHGAPVLAAPPPVDRAFEHFAVTGHQQRNECPEGCVAHEIYVTGGLRLL